MPLSWLVMQAGEERYYKTTLDAWSKIYHKEGPAAFFKVVLLKALSALHFAHIHKAVLRLHSSSHVP